MSVSAGDSRVSDYFSMYLVLASGWIRDVIADAESRQGRADTIGHGG
jgi:hypothetical protein